MGWSTTTAGSPASNPDWDDYRRAMVDQRRVLIWLAIDNVGPTHAG
jgi:hypothetical protein